MTLSTWTKESKGLYYLKAPPKELVVHHYYLTESRVFLGNPREGKTYFTNQYVQNEFTKDLKKFQIILGNDNHEENFLSSVNEPITPSTKVWISIESEMHDSETKINLGDHLRFGRQVVRVAKIFRLNKQNPERMTTLPNQTPGQNPITNSPGLNTQKNRKIDGVLNQLNNNLKESDLIGCRICLEPETFDRPFEREMCSCSINMPAHFDCLKQWLQKKCEAVKTGRITYYDIDKLKCDICKQVYRPIVYLNGKEFNLLDIQPSPKKPALLLEVIKSSNNTVSGLYLIEIDEKISNVITIGRTGKTDLRFNDASVSRNHANIVWSFDEFYVMDLKSKFGSCKLLNDRISFFQTDNKKFLIDKYMFTFHVMRTKKHCECFKKGLPFITNPLDNVPKLQIEDGLDLPLRIDPRIDDSLPLIVSAQFRVGNSDQSIQRTPLKPLNPEGVIGNSNGRIESTNKQQPIEKSLSIQENSLKVIRRFDERHSKSNVVEPYNQSLEYKNESREKSVHLNFHDISLNGYVNRSVGNKDKSINVQKEVQNKSVREDPQVYKKINDASEISRPFMISQFESIDLHGDSLLESRNSYDYFNKVLNFEAPNQPNSPKKNESSPKRVFFKKLENEDKAQARYSTLNRVSYTNLPHQQSSECLVFADRTISDLAFDQCEDFEFN
jgi:hypothetical protein